MAKEHEEWHRSIASVRREVDKLSENIGQQSKTLNSLRDSIKALAQVISPIRDAMKFIGEQRIEDCVYSRNGYCEHITKAIPESELSEEERSTTQKEDRYYPRVRWVDCYLCTKCEVPPSYVEKEKKK